MDVMALFGLAIVIMVCVMFGAAGTLYIGKHYINHYVAKLNISELQKVNQAKAEQEAVSEEAFWTSGLTHNEFNKQMEEDEDEEV